MSLKTKSLFIFLLTLFPLLSCKEKQQDLGTFYDFNQSEFNYQGRYDTLDAGIVLISSAASVTFKVKSESLTLALDITNDTHNYISLAIDDHYKERYRIENKSLLKLKLPDSEIHKITVFKATEAATGNIVFKGAYGDEILPFKNTSDFAIEFIGNSITCGMAADTRTIDCGEGLWFDQHNAPLAYGPKVAKALNADFMLNAVSGIGMYRNWNDENREEPIMPQVYGNLYLNEDTSKLYDYTFHPDIISICLGTNDLSEGDGKKERFPFNNDKFLRNYLKFVENLYQHHPETTIVLLNSPMLADTKDELLRNCLEEVALHFTNLGKKIHTFTLKPMHPKGCTYHPSIEDHTMIANQLIPYFKSIKNE